MGRMLAVVYGFVCYAIFLGIFLYAIGFVENAVVPKPIDFRTASGTGTALLVDMLLLGLFAVQHSAMARPAFKRRWTRIIPAPIERSTYVLLTCAVMALLFWQWRPLLGIVWKADSGTLRALLYGISLLGWLIVLCATFMINHFDLFGLRQVVAYARNAPLAPLPFTTRWLYRIVRHPIMLGFIIAFWAAPTMTVGHLLFAIATTGYILVALQLEEHDLRQTFGERYVAYQQEVRMLLPLPNGGAHPTDTETRPTAVRG
jgi:methanethiol S-methyltransferase